MKGQTLNNTAESMEYSAVTYKLNFQNSLAPEIKFQIRY